ncbi:MAG: glycosyltransferase, partial [Muribaculaceae bacterium]|nr:glycosyltransferase [Muribaculaceae bacterium]
TDAIPGIYASADVVLSTSYYETLPGTLVEGQAYGCIPVAFDSGGQRDIVDHLSTGYIATPYDTAEIADGIAWAYRTLRDEDTHIIGRMRQSVITKFSSQNIARRYLELLAEKNDLNQTHFPVERGQSDTLI